MQQIDRFKIDPRAAFDIVLILVCTLAVFGRSLSNYFLADDFGELHYCWRIFSGDIGLLLQNFTGNYMQIEGMNVYRPFLLLSLMVDFLLWRGNAFGYYLTNLCFYFFDAALLYLIVLKFSPSQKQLNNRLTAVCAAIMFVVSPLHCESVSWVVGRVDIICATLYLLSIYLILLNLERRSRFLTTGAIAAFISALLVKEMAIGIPVLAFGLRFLHKEREALQERFTNALKLSSPYFCATVFYFLIRYVCLGTLVGGYVAGFGASQEADLLTRWFDIDSLKRFAFPLVLNQFSAEKQIVFGLSILYVITATVAVLRMTAGALPLRFFACLLLWAATTLAPIYKLWGLGFHLEGARFVFFLTLPLSVLFAACLFQDRSDADNHKYQRSFMLVTLVVAHSSLALYSMITIKTNAIWVNAGRQVRSAIAEATKILAEDNEKTAVFLGIPRERLGTHMILNGDTFTTAINPPFVSAPPKRRYAVLEPTMYSTVHDFDSARFRQLKDSGAEIYVWNLQKLKFEPITFSGADGTQLSLNGQNEGGRIESIGPIRHTNSGFAVMPGSQTTEPQLLLTKLGINPTTCDFLSVQLQLKNPVKGNVYRLRAAWNSGEGVSEEECFADGTALAQEQLQTVYLAHSKRWTWYMKPTVESIRVSLPSTKMDVQSLSFQKQKEVCPLLSLSISPLSETGAYQVRAATDTLNIDASGMKRCSAVRVEISKCNYFFDTFREGDSSEAVQSDTLINLDGDKKGKLKLTRKEFKVKGYYQLRAQALGKDNEPVQAYSSCLTLKILD